MNVPSQSQINAGLRYAGTAVGTIGTVATVMGVLPPDTAHAIVQSSQKVLTDLQQLIGDSYLLFVLVFPVIVGWLARVGYKSASPKSQVAAVQAMPAVQVTVSDPNLATAGVKVVDKLP